LSKALIVYQTAHKVSCRCRDEVSLDEVERILI